MISLHMPTQMLAGSLAAGVGKSPLVKPASPRRLGVANSTCEFERVQENNSTKQLTFKSVRVYRQP
jgi:hypothetical protein